MMMLIFLLSAGLGSLGAVIWRVLWSLFHGGKEEDRTGFPSLHVNLCFRVRNAYRLPCKRGHLPTATEEENMQLRNDLRLIGPNGFNQRGSLQVVKQSPVHQETYLKS